MPVYSIEGLTNGDLYGMCDECETGSRSDPRALYSRDGGDEGPWLCSRCYDASHGYDEESEESEDGEAVSHEERYSFESDYFVVAPPPYLLLPVLPNRNARLLSMEQEVGHGGDILAERFYSHGYTRHGYMLGYHHTERTDEPPSFLTVEEDVSVNGEIIYSRLDLSDESTARRLVGAMNVVRETIAEGSAKLDMRCGFHIHVDIGPSERHPAYGMEDVESLYHLWNYLEDTIYRLASANWRGHRTAYASRNYAQMIAKGLNTRREIGQWFDSARNALNLSNYLQARGYCHCGAFQFADWKECECTLPKATVEFRVFNATANLRKVHAYSALSLAMVEASTRERFTVAKHPPHGWEGEGTFDTDQAKAALSFIMERLPLTEDERSDIAYCAENSSLAEVYSAL